MMVSLFEFENVSKTNKQTNLLLLRRQDLTDRCLEFEIGLDGSKHYVFLFHRKQTNKEINKQQRLIYTRAHTNTHTHANTNAYTLGIS
jgi:hypothetical protein